MYLSEFTIVHRGFLKHSLIHSFTHSHPCGRLPFNSSTLQSSSHPQAPPGPIISLHKCVGFVEVGDLHILCVPEKFLSSGVSVFSFVVFHLEVVALDG